MMKSFVLILFVILPIVALANDNELKICLTGSTEKALPKYGEAFVNGAMLAINKLSSIDKKKVKLEVMYYDSNPLAPIAKLEEMHKKNCDAIIGFSTGNDLIAIEDSLKAKPIFTLSIYGDPQDRFNETNYLRTMQPSAKSLVNHLFKTLPFKIKNEDKVLVITASDRSEMHSYKVAYLEKLSGKAQVTQVDVMEQIHDLKQFEETIQKNIKWDYVVILTRSLIAAEISDLIYQKHNPIILGTKYLGSSELPAFLNYVKNKKIQAYISRQNCLCNSFPPYQEIRNQYEETFKTPPMSISIDSFDATNFILQSLKAPKLDNAQVLKFLNSKKSNFTGVSSLKISKGLKLSSTKRFLIKIDESGYKEVK